MSHEPEYRALTLRLPEQLHAAVRVRAAKHDRSAGAEVRMIVREALQRERATTRTADGTRIP